MPWQSKENEPYSAVEWHFNCAKETEMPPDNLGSRLDQALAAPDASMPAELPWAEALGFDDVLDALAAPIAPEPPVVERAGPPGLERRVLVLERLLQALLAQLAKAEPDLLARLDDALSASLLSARADGDKAIDSCAAALIHAALRTAGEAAAATPEVAEAFHPAVEAGPSDRHNDQLSFRPPPFHFRKVGGIWRLTRNRPPRSAAMQEEQ